MEQTDIQKDYTSAFTGHRHIPYKDKAHLKDMIRQAVLACHQSGIRYFQCGMAAGFDLLAAEAVLEIKKEHPDIHLIAVIPFRNQPDRYSPMDKSRYLRVLEKADKAVVLSATYFDGCFLRRNDYMLGHSCRVIAYFNGEHKGGTYYTCKRAKRMGLGICNLYQQPKLY